MNFKRTSLKLLLCYLSLAKTTSSSAYYCPSVVTNTLPSGNGVVRLYRNRVTSSSYYYGIVQIWYNRQWGNICDDFYYDQFEADVICHQLGYTGAISFSRAGLVRSVYNTLVVCTLFLF